MNTSELIYEKTKRLPEALAHQVLDYVEFLTSKSETLAVLQNPGLMAQIRASEQTFAEKTGFVPDEGQWYGQS